MDNAHQEWHEYSKLEKSKNAWQSPFGSPKMDWENWNYKANKVDEQQLWLYMHLRTLLYFSNEICIQTYNDSRDMLQNISPKE